MAEPILNLKVLTIRKRISIEIRDDDAGTSDTQLYELRNPQEFDLLAFNRLNLMGAEAQRLKARVEMDEANGKSPAEADTMRLEELAAAMVELVLIAPPVIRRRLGGLQRLMVIGAFTGVPALIPQAPRTIPAAGAPSET